MVLESLILSQYSRRCDLCIQYLVSCIRGNVREVRPNTLWCNNIIIFLWLYIHQDYSISIFTPKWNPSCWLHKQWILIIKEKKWKTSFPMTWCNYRWWCIYLQEVLLARCSRLTYITKTCNIAYFSCSFTTKFDYCVSLHEQAMKKEVSNWEYVRISHKYESKYFYEIQRYFV